MKTDIARRNFVARLAVVLGYAGLAPIGLPAQARGRQGAVAGKAAPDPKKVDYDKLVKLANNENPYGPSQTVMKAMTDAWKYANRYAYPDGGIVDAIAELHGVKPENVVLGCGSSEILKIVDDAFLPDHKLVVGAEPTYETVYRYATNTKARKAITLYADNSRRASPWAERIYRDARARGCRHAHAIRILARAWLRVIWACWHTNTPYDPTRRRGHDRHLTPLTLT